MQCISINQNFANSATISNIYRNLLLALKRVEDSIEDVKPMLKQRLGDAIAFRQVDSGVAEDVLAWEVEWAEEVQKVLEMDAGWGLSGFWDMVLYNLKVSREMDEYRRQSTRGLIISIPCPEPRCSI
jgi:hypothetical protein